MVTDCLKGIRVLDLSQYEAGPSCSETLAWLGAEVVKVEKPGTGEPARYGYPRKPDKDSWYFNQFNANKKSIDIDLKTPEGVELVRRMAGVADVFLENLAPGTIERLGLGYDVLKAINPALVYAQIKGFGEGSPYEHYLSYDPVGQATSGVMSVTGAADGPPVKPGPGLGDTGTGMLLAISILGALYRRHATGEGQRLQVAMQDACMHYIRLAWAYNHAFGKACGRHGAKSVTGMIVPMGVYPCAPGGPNDYVYLYCHAGVPEQFHRLLKVIGREEWIGDPRFEVLATRREHEAEINAAISEWTMQRDKYEAMRILGEAKIPTGAVRDTQELLDDPDFERRGLMQRVDHPEIGSFKMVTWPVRHDGAFATLKRAPLVGEDREDVLASWLGDGDDPSARPAAAQPTTGDPLWQN